MKIFCPYQRVLSKYRGFSLLELAIVLLVAGVIIGAVWVAAGSAWDSYRISRATQQITSATQNIREYYTNAQQFPFAANTDITANLDGLNLFPVEMRRSPGAVNPILDHPMNNSITTGSFHVLSVKCLGGTTITCFRFQMEGLTPAFCARLLNAVPVNNADLGILAVGTQNGSPLQDVAPSTAGTPTAVTASMAATWCRQPGAANEVDWDFKLHD